MKLNISKLFSFLTFLASQIVCAQQTSLPPLDFSAPNTRSEAGKMPAHSSTPPANEDDFVFREEVIRTYTSLRIVDSSNVPVSDVRKEEIEVYEDGVKQQIEAFDLNSLGVSLAIAVDVSGSMDTYLSAVQRGAGNTIQTLKDLDQVAIVQFDNEALPMTLTAGGRGAQRYFTNDKSKAKQAIEKLRSGGLTSLYDTIDAVSKKLFDSSGARQTALILLTDGEDSSSKKNDEQAIQAIERKGVVTFPIHVGRNHPELTKVFMKNLALRSGGEYFQADGSAEIESAFSKISERLRALYGVGYKSNSKTQNRWRSVSVHIKRPGLKVISRKGYCPNDYCEGPSGTAEGTIPESAEEALWLHRNFYLDRTLEGSIFRSQGVLKLNRDTPVVYFSKSGVATDGVERFANHCFVTATEDVLANDLRVIKDQNLKLTTMDASIVKPFPKGSPAEQKIWMSEVIFDFATVDSISLSVRCRWPLQVLTDQSLDQALNQISIFIRPSKGK